MTDSKMNAEGWETAPRTPHKIKPSVLIAVPAGNFLMGTSDENIKQLQLKESDWAYEWSDNDLFIAEQPQHLVSLPAFEISQYLVTNAEYYTFIWDLGHRLPRNWPGYTFPEGTDDHPVVGVSKIDVDAYIQWYNTKTEMNYRLPTEAEWERAARGEDGRIYPWGNTFDPWRCNTSESAKKGTTSVGFYSPSGDSVYGAADMVGNVWEWTASRYGSNPFKAGEHYVNPTGIEAGGSRVLRGSSWYAYNSRGLQPAARVASHPGTEISYVGFRVVRTNP